MHFIDTADLSEDELRDLASINDQLAELASRRKDKLDLLDEPWRRSKIAWKIALFSNAMVHRFISLADGVALSWNKENTLSAVLSARAMVETAAIYWEFGGLVNEHFEARDFGELDRLAMNYLFSTREAEVLAEHPELKARQVLNAIDLIDKTIIPHFRSHYDRLSERCHPNSAGHRMLFSRLDRETGIAAFTQGQDERLLLPIKCALGTAVLFKHALNAIEEDIGPLAEAHHAAHPSPLV
jgi:hypothetical protein